MALLMRCGNQLFKHLGAARRVSSGGAVVAVLQESSSGADAALQSGIRASKHELIYTFKAPLLPQRNRHSLQYSKTEHMSAVPQKGDNVFTDASVVKSSGEGIWVFMNHAFHAEASVYLRPVEYRHIDPSVGCIAVYAAKDLVPGELLTFDYTLHEWEMSSPFRCISSGRMVQGFKHLTEEEQHLALPYAWAHVRQLHDEHRGFNPLLTCLQLSGAGKYTWRSE